jgi:hypothetical protein
VKASRSSYTHMTKQISNQKKRQRKSLHIDQIQKIIKEYFENVYCNKLQNLEEIYISRCIWPTYIEPRRYKLLKQIMSNEIELKQ